jgi:hypothetical protein
MQGFGGTVADDSVKAIVKRASILMAAEEKKLSEDEREGGGSDRGDDLLDSGGEPEMGFTDEGAGMSILSLLS